MKKSLTFLGGILLLLATAWPAMATHKDSPGSAVWQLYLSDKEQLALKELAIMAHGDDNANTDSQEITLPMLREQFESMFTPAITLPPAEPFNENGVKGIWLKPKNASQERVLLYFHGGGYVIGSPKTGSTVSSFLAQQANILCFILDYPLAPENPFPAAPDNALAAYQMLLEKGFKPENIVFAGDSAGGGLALAALLKIRDSGLTLPAGAYLLSPWTDLSHSFDSHTSKKETDIFLTLEFLQNMAAMYAGKNDLKNPLISPAFANLHALPPLLIHVGSHEILLDDSLILARNAALADVPVTLKIWPGYPHVFQMSPNELEGARKALIEGAYFFNEAINSTLLRPANAANGSVTP